MRAFGTAGGEGVKDEKKRQIERVCREWKGDWSAIIVGIYGLRNNL